jgi:acyl-CoA dehydrogenase
VFFALTDEQLAFGDAVRSLLADRFDAASVRAVYDDPAGDANPGQLWKSFAEQGLFAVLVPEELGGLGLGLLDASVVARVLGAHVVPSPWLSTVVGAEAIRLGGSGSQLEQWLPRVAAGEVRLALASRGPGGAWDTGGVAVTADAGRLSGVATLVEAAHVADAVVVAATGVDGVGLYIVDTRAAGVTVRRHETLDRTTRLCDVVLDEAPGERLAASSATVLADVLDRGTVLVANDLAGIAREALIRTVSYDRERRQFGQPVGSFQAVKHALADIHVAVTMAEHASLYAAHAVDEALPEAATAVSVAKATAVSVAKAKASDAAVLATAAMVQFHGGIGYTWEHDAHFFLKRAKRQEHMFGDATWHRERIARLVIDVT